MGSVAAIIRRATGDDAAELTAFMTRLVDEPHNNIVHDPGQWTKTVEEEREFLEKARAGVNQYFVVAVVEGKIVGCADIHRRSALTARHVGSLGVSVDAAYRRRGVGRALMQALIGWAKEQELRRVELKVFVRNVGAIRLYEQLGFVIEGLHRMALCKQGVWVDEYTMAMILDER